VFFKRQGLESSFIPSSRSPESKPERDNPHPGDSRRQRALAMMAMAVAVASPLNPMRHSAWAADAPPADNRPQLEAQPAPPVQPTAQPDVTAQPPVQLDTQADQQMSDADKLREGLKRYKDKQYEEAQSILQQVNADNLSDKEKKSLTDTLSKTESAANERRSARAAFEQGEQALQNNQPADAIKLYKQAADNKYVDEGTRQKAKEQITLAEAAQKQIQGNLRQSYDDAKADFKAGRYADARTKFEVLSNAGFKAPLFQKSPGDYLKEIDKRAPKTEMAQTPAPEAAPTSQPAPAEATAAVPTPAPAEAAQATPAPAPAATPTTAPAEAASAAPEASPAAPMAVTEADRKATAKSAYKLARDQYRKGDWRAARENFNIAQDNGYKAGLFEDSPAKYLARMDAKESADAAKTKADAERNAMAEAAAPPTVVAAVPTDTTNTTPAAAPATMPAPVAAAPSTAPMAANPQAELQDTAQMEKVKSQQNSFEAKQLVARGQAAQDKNNYEQALDNYTRAADLDPTNQQALAGREKMLQLLGRQPGREDQLTRVQKEIEIRRQEIMYRVDQALEEATNAVRQNDYTGAQAAVDRARVALNTDRTIFTPDELRRMETRIANAQTDVTARSQVYAQQEAVANQKAANAAENQRVQIQEETKRRQVASLISRSRSAVNEGKYDEALGIIDQILILDPQNDYAVGVRALVEDRALFLQQRKYHEDFERQITVQLNANEERKIPYSDILRFPDNWPDLSATRDESVRRERGEESEDADVQRQLDRVLPEVNFNQVAFGDVIDFLRDITTANIFVNWRALEAAGVDKNAPVTARLRNVKFSKALNLILADVSAQATAKLGYTTGDGVITISTDEEIGKNTTQLVYDISDLLFSPPDPTDIPQFNIQSQATTSGKGGGGGSSGQGLFGGGGGTGGSQNGDETRRASEEAREDMIKLIQEAIAPESWKENGGIGSIRVQSGTGRLIVSQTAENQRAIARLLDKLREGLAIQIMVETRFLSVQRNFLEDVGIDFDFTFNNANPNDPNRKFAPISVAQSSFNFTTASSVDTGLPGNLSGAVAESPALSTAVSFVDDFTVNALIRATQAEQTSTQVQAPRIMVYNGKTAYVVVSTERAYVSDLTPVVGQNAIGFDPTISIVDSGVSLVVTATASADRKYVTMNLKPRLQRLLNLVPFVFGSNTIIPNSTIDTSTQPISAGEGVVQQPELSVTFLETTVSVPDGATLLLGGQTLTGEISREEGVPVLSKIPFLKRLFTNRAMSRDDVVLLILVKPTIVIEREQEAKQFPLLTSNKSPG
jgi:general secretion pathway protein D